MIKNWPPYEDLSNRILSVIPKYNSLVLEVVNSKSSKFNVINHGDLWINNCLYKYDQHSEQSKDVLFVDFQLCFWGSCGFDIIWILNSSLELNVLKYKRQFIIKTYYDTLRQTLEKINYPEEEIPSLEDVLLEIKRCEFIGFYIALCEFPIFVLAKSQSEGLDSAAFSQLKKMKKLRVLLYDTPRVRETLKYSLNMLKTVLSPLLNEELIKRALQSYHNVNNACALQLKACDFKLSPADGGNFCSDIYEVEVQYEIDGNAINNSFIVKMMIPEIAEIGSNEQVMFNTVLPGMEKCLNIVKKENANKLHAKCLISERNKDEFYVLENLNSMGYYCADRVKGLDLEHSEILMKKIAKFHAASMMFNKKFPEVVASLSGSHFEKGASDVIAEAIAFGGFEYVSNMIKNWPSYEHLSEKVRSLIPKFNSLVMEVVNPKNSKFNVITHGDLWVNNFLYKYDKDSNKPIDVLFVDFQNSFWGSCAYDINYFLNTSLELEILRENRKHLIYIYYNELKETLVTANYPEQEIPTLADVLMEIQRCELIGLYCSLCELPIVSLEKSKSQGFNCSTYSQPEKMKEMRNLMYANPRVIETLKHILKYYEENNVL